MKTRDRFEYIFRIDILTEIPRDTWDSMIGSDGRLCQTLADKGVRLFESPSLTVMYIGMNMRDATLGKNRKLRQALNAAFDYPAWARFNNGRIRPGDGPVPPGIDGRLETPFQYCYDIELAKRLLAEAGYPNGIDSRTGRRLTLKLAIGRPNQESREAGDLTAAFYDRIGIKLELQFFTWDAFLKAVNDGRVQLFRMGWVADYPDAQNFLQLFYSPNVSPGSNRSNYVNPEFDALYDRIVALPDSPERDALCRDAAKLVMDDCPWILTGYPLAFSLRRSRLRNCLQTDFSWNTEKYWARPLSP